MIINKFSDLCDCGFRISTLLVVEKTVSPPVPFICKAGDLLFERFFYVTQGKIIFNVNDEILEFSAGDIVYLPYDVTYTSHWDTAEEGGFISINFILRDEHNEIISLSNTIELMFRDSSSKYYRLFKEMSDTWNSGATGYKLLNHAQFYNVLYSMNNDKTRIKLRTNNNKIYKSILYLDNNYLSEVTTSELACMSGLKDCMYRRIFKQIKGMSPMQYRNMLRINKASEILATGDFSVIEAMLLTGFNDASYFYKLFKKQFSKAPSDFKPQ